MILSFFKSMKSIIIAKGTPNKRDMNRMTYKTLIKFAFQTTVKHQTHKQPDTLQTRYVFTTRK